MLQAEPHELNPELKSLQDLGLPTSFATSKVHHYAQPMWLLLCRPSDGSSCLCPGASRASCSLILTGLLRCLSRCTAAPIMSGTQVRPVALRAQAPALRVKPPGCLLRVASCATRSKAAPPAAPAAHGSRPSTPPPATCTITGSPRRQVPWLQVLPASGLLPLLSVAGAVIGTAYLLVRQLANEQLLTWVECAPAAELHMMSCRPRMCHAGDAVGGSC